MRITIRGRNLTVSEGDGAYVERKLGRIERMLGERGEADVELRLEGNHKVADSHVVDVSLLVDGLSVRGNAAASTFREATDEVIDRLERRTVNYRQRPRDRRRSEQVRHGGLSPRGGPGSGSGLPPDQGAEPGSPPAAEGSAVVKVKRFAIEPMFEEDAISRMEELGHTFFIFVNAESERIAVLYRRRDRRYGLIEPVIGGGYGLGS